MGQGFGSGQHAGRARAGSRMADTRMVVAFNRRAQTTLLTLACMALAVATGFPVSTTAQAQQAPKAAAKPAEVDPKKQAAAQARASLDAGSKSFATGKWQLASDQLSTALRGGGLPGTDMARALYMRGVAYKKLSKPGLAISDLTSAIWLKNGLSDADKQAATAERAEAYKMAGLADTGNGAERAVVADPNPQARVAEASQPAPVAPAPVAAKPEKSANKKAKKPDAASAAASPSTATSDWSSAPPATVSRQSPDSESAKDAARARQLAMQRIETYDLASTPARDLNTQPSNNTTAPTTSLPNSVAVTPAVPAPLQQTAAVPAPIPAAVASPAATPDPATTLSALPGNDAPAAAPTTASLPSLANVPSTVSGFFSNLFGGGSQTSAPAQVATPDTGAAAEAVTSAPALTTASTTPLAPAPSAANNAAGVTAQTKQALKPGKFKLHIAAVRSRAEADQLAQSLTQKHANDLSARLPVVDEAVIGSMGKFYRVRVGSYANADEPRGVCNKLRTSGFDCLVVTN